MSLSLLFWVIVLVYALLGIWHWRKLNLTETMVTVLVILLGWQVFGSAIHR